MGMTVSRPALRWLVPVGVAAVILAAGAATAAIRASADAGLAPRTAAQLLTDLQTARLGAATGTLVEHADLGIPALPSGIGGDGSTQFDSLLTGSHTLRIWYDGPQRDRIALIGALGESDIIRNGPDLWIWSSLDNTATHMTVPVAPTTAKSPAGRPSSLSTLTPSSIAAGALAVVSPSTSVTAGETAVIAGRPAYELVIAPKDPASLIGSIRIAIDATQHIPLRVEIFAAGSAKPAFDLGYSQISFARPDPAAFKFNPPPHVIRHEVTSSPTGPVTGAPAPAEALHVIGSGWTAVVSGPAPFVDNGAGGQGDNAIDAITKGLPTVNGPWGSGKVISTALFSALLTTNGQMYIGAVNEARLLAAVTAAAAK